MRNLTMIVLSVARVEVLRILRSPLFLVLTVVQALLFLVLVSLFGITGNRAPTDVINNDTGPYSQLLIADLKNAHRSFAINVVTGAAAQAAYSEYRNGSIVAVIVIPQDFSAMIMARQNSPYVQVGVDNLNTDMTEDIIRGIPSALLTFGNQLHMSGIYVHTTEFDLVPHETGFVPYLVVSAIVLDAFIIAGTLNAIAVTHEFESGTARVLALAPVSPLLMLLGKMLVADAISLLAIALTVGSIDLLYHVTPLFPLEAASVLLLCVLLFGCVGAALGAWLKRSLPVASVIFGSALPLYLDSGSLEPARFYGQGIWLLAHATPVYYAVDLLEEAFHGIQVTPESTSVNMLILLLWAVFGLLGAALFMKRSAL